MQHAERVTAVIEREGDGYVALCPALDIASQGDTIEEALGPSFEAVSTAEMADSFHWKVYVTHLDDAVE